MLTFALPGVSTDISMRRGEPLPSVSLRRVGEMVTLTNAKAPLVPPLYHLGAVASFVVYEFVYGLIIKGLLVSVSFVPSFGLYAIYAVWGILVAMSISA